MQTVTEHLNKNRQYANETKETVVIQIKGDDGHWKDHSRCTLEQAQTFIERKIRHDLADHWRAVDWISKEQIALASA